MAQEHDQESTKGQKPALNEIQPGMEVEDTDMNWAKAILASLR